MHKFRRGEWEGVFGDMNLVGYIQENRNSLVWLKKVLGLAMAAIFQDGRRQFSTDFG